MTPAIILSKRIPCSFNREVVWCLNLLAHYIQVLISCFPEKLFSVSVRAIFATKFQLSEKVFIQCICMSWNQQFKSKLFAFFPVRGGQDYSSQPWKLLTLGENPFLFLYVFSDQVNVWSAWRTTYQTTIVMTYGHQSRREQQHEMRVEQKRSGGSEVELKITHVESAMFSMWNLDTDTGTGPTVRFVHHWTMLLTDPLNIEHRLC